MPQRYARLLEPFRIKNVRLRNRIVKPAQVMGYAGEDGSVSERVINFNEALAKGGAGLVVVEAAAVDYPLGVTGSPRLVINDEKYLPGFRKLTDAIHRHGCPTFLQLQHGGPAHSLKVYGGQGTQAAGATGTQPVAASMLTAEQSPLGGQNLPRGLSVDEIKDVIQKFAAAAELALEAGFDGVELHFAHTYLVNSFLSRAWNRRDDEYGGSLTNRVRIATGILQAVRRRVGDRIIVGARMNGIEGGVPDGLTSEETQAIARMLELAGIDYLSVTGWGYGLYQWLMFPEQLQYPESRVPLAKQVRNPGILVPSAAAIRQAVSVPVIAVGRLDPEMGEKILRRGQADLIGLARRLLADPELPNKLAAGRPEDVKPCTACLTCFHTFAMGEPSRCRINAPMGREKEYALREAEKKKRVVVVGGGPAGLEAARMAALRGHEVTLLEKGSKPGGLLPLAAMIKGTGIEDLPGLVSYFRTQLRKLGVAVRPGQQVDAALIERLKPDAVIVASGGKPAVPDIPGMAAAGVLTAAELHRRAKFFLRFFGPRLLNRLSRVWLPVGRRVVILGGLIQGCEVAEFLAKRGRQVTVLEAGGQLGTGIPELNRVRLLDWFRRKGVNALSGVSFKEVARGSVTITDSQGKEQTFKADTILVALPAEPDKALYDSLRGRVPEVYLIGDSSEPGLIVDAVDAGYRAGNSV